MSGCRSEGIRNIAASAVSERGVRKACFDFLDVCRGVSIAASQSVKTVKASARFLLLMRSERRGAHTGIVVCEPGKAGAGSGSLVFRSGSELCDRMNDGNAGFALSLIVVSYLEEKKGVCVYRLTKFDIVAMHQYSTLLYRGIVLFNVNSTPKDRDSSKMS